MRHITLKLMLALLSIFLISTTAFAAKENTVSTNPNTVNVGTAMPLANTPKPPVILPPPPAIDAKSYVLMDYQTGQILASKNMHQERAPASLTKLMTLYITFSAIDSDQIKLNDKVQISKTAWQTGGSRMFINVGSFVPVKDLIQGVIVDSGNDATVALSEYIAGSQKAFVPLMNQQAKALGMKNTHYSDVNGLPVKDHYSSAYDLALLTRATIHNYPDQYHWFKEKYFTWDKIKQTNRNWLLFRDPSVDGLKTGHTKAAGYCLISSAKRDGMRLITVVMGTPTEEARVDTSERLLNYGFRFFQTYNIYQANTPITQARVWGGERSKVGMGLAQALTLSIPKGQYSQLNIKVELNGTIHAPVVKDQSYGTVTVSLKGKVLAKKPIIALENDPEGGLWTRFTDAISLKFHKWFS